MSSLSYFCSVWTRTGKCYCNWFTTCLQAPGRVFARVFVMSKQFCWHQIHWLFIIHCLDHLVTSSFLNSTIEDENKKWCLIPVWVDWKHKMKKPIVISTFTGIHYSTEDSMVGFSLSVPIFQYLDQSRWNPVLWLEACCGRMIKAFPKAHSIEYYIWSNILYAQIQDWGLIGAHCQTPPPPIWWRIYLSNYMAIKVFFTSAHCHSEFLIGG